MSLSIAEGIARPIGRQRVLFAMLGFAVGMGQERFVWRQIGAIAIGVLGILVLFGPDALAGHLHLSELLGASGVVIGRLAYSAGSVMARPLMHTLAPGQMAAMTNLIGGVLLLLASVAFEPGARAALVTGTTLFGEKLDATDVAGMLLMLSAAAMVLRRR